MFKQGFKARVSFYLSKNLVMSDKPLKNNYLKKSFSGSEKQIIS